MMFLSHVFYAELIECQQFFIKLQSLIKYSYVWIVHTFVVNSNTWNVLTCVPDTVNNLMQLGFSFAFYFETSCTNQEIILLILHKICIVLTR